MATVYLRRQRRSDHGTEGVLIAPCFGFTSGAPLYVIELPWRGNASNISCIPDGTYLCRIRESKRFGRTYHVLDVAGRSFILMHAGNWAGDRSKGLLSNSHGCILLGLKRGVARGQRAVLNSRTAVRRFVEAAGGEEFQLVIGGFADAA